MFASACQNNGDIGDLFGVWALESYTVDGNRCRDRYIDNTTFSFQNNIVEVVSQYDDYLSAYQTYGEWIWRDGDTLMFSFQHHDDTDSQEQYSAPTWIGFTAREIMMVNVSDRSSRRMTLTWDYEGSTHVYKLKKMD